MTQPDLEAIPAAVAAALVAGAQAPAAALANHDPATGAWFAKPHILFVALPKLVICGEFAPGTLGYKCGRERHADPWHLVIQSGHVRGAWLGKPKPVIDVSSTDELPSTHAQG